MGVPMVRFIAVAAAWSIARYPGRGNYRGIVLKYFSRYFSLPCLNLRARKGYELCLIGKPPNVILPVLAKGDWVYHVDLSYGLLQMLSSIHIFRLLWNANLSQLCLA